MDISTFINAATGQFGALVVSLAALYLLMKHHKETLDRMYDDHKADRDLYQTTLVNLSHKIDKIGDDIAEIKRELS
jgi:hypothetical protein